MMISKAGKTDRGFTLFELLVTIALTAMAMTVVVSQMGRMLDWELKAASRKLSRTIRYLYNKAATENITIRLVLNLDESSYHVEASSDPVSLVQEETEEEGRQPGSSVTGKTTEEKEGKEVIRPNEPVFNPTESYLLKPVKLPDGIYFKDVYTEHQIERLSKGVAYLYFFPQGYVERAVIHLRDEADESHYSLQVNPISGNVKIEPEYKEPEIRR